MLRLPGSNLVTPFIYGTAWKKEATAALVTKALDAGFRAIDTAAQPKHYQEHLVGEGIREAVRAGIVTRNELHIQTKYTAPSGQDLRNMPYDPASPISAQVSASVASSLKNLRITDNSKNDQNYIDCLILHSPLATLEKTLQAWEAMASFVPEKVRSLGISNASLPVLRALWSQTAIPPYVVQNRFHKVTGYDEDIRVFCREKGIIYQSFWTLTANPKLLRSAPVEEVSQAVGVGKELALYALVSDLDIVVLNGTTNAETMKRDISGIKQIETFKKETGNSDVWAKWRDQFIAVLGT
ncbi:hypothetical protein MMC10_002485 [Thelotrema lepadinum]|nr:hypothetical protein [Thelotrema lepadinum]